MTPDKFVDTVRLMGERMKELETILKKLAQEHSETYRAVFIGDDDPAIRAVIRNIPSQVKAIEDVERQLAGLKKQLSAIEDWVGEGKRRVESRNTWFERVGKKVLELVVTALVFAVFLYFGWDKFLK